MIAINRDYAPETPTTRGNFLRDRRINILIYIDEDNLKNPEDSTAYVYNTLRQSPEKYNVRISFERNPDLAEEADVVFSRFDIPKRIDDIKNQKEFLEQLVQYESRRIFYNRPTVQLAYRDKSYLEKLRGTGLIPESLFTSSPHKLFDFMRELGEKIVIKPIFGYGGEGVKSFEKEEYNEAVDYLDSLLLDGQRRAVVQRFLPEIYTEGDKRVVVVDGDVIGAILRKPKTGDFRANIHSGGSAEDTIVTLRDLRIVETAKQYLPEISQGWWGLDIIGDYLGEANSSSPGLAHKIDTVNGNTNFMDAIKKNIENSRKLEVAA